MLDQVNAIPTPPKRVPWNKGKLTGAKPPLRPKHVWSIRTKLQIEGRARDLAMFNLAIDSKLRGCDVRAACVAMAKRIADTIGPVSILVNNAGIARRNGMTGAADAVIKDWEDVIAINLTGVFNVTHAFLGSLRANKGRIVNIGSIQSFVHIRQPSSPAYTASKHGVLGFTRALAVELGKDGVRVNAIGPGFIATPLNAATRANNPEAVRLF